MRAAIHTAILFALIALALPVLANDPEVETRAAPLDDLQDATEVTPRTPLQNAIAEIQQQATEQVELLHRRLLEMVPGSAEAREADLQIRDAKQDAEIRILQAILADALDRGDEQTRAEVELAIDHILHPENYPTQTFPSTRPAPEGR